MGTSKGVGEGIKVAIIGGGPARLAAAIELTRLPFVNWRLYEQKPAINEIGTGITLQRNTWRLLEQLGASKHLGPDDFFRPADGHDNKDGRTGTVVKQTHPPAHVAPHQAPCRAYRGKLQKALLQEVDESRIQTGMKLNEIQRLPCGKLRLTFSNGFTDEVDLLVGADGIRSVVSHLAFPEYSVSYTGMTAYRSVVKVRDVGRIDGVPKTTVFWYSTDGKWIYTTPLDNNDWEITCRIREADDGNRSTCGKEVSVAEFIKGFQEYCPPVQQLLSLVTQVKRFDYFGGTRLDSVVKYGSVALIGDASHPLSGAFGAGAAFALEDAHVLAGALRWGASSARELHDSAVPGSNTSVKARFVLDRYNRCSMSTSPFKVIVVGGGPVGLVAAHALHHAGIDFLVLEQRNDIFEDVGASLIVSPHNLRVFHQLGLWKRIEELGAPLLHHSEGFDWQKHTFKRSYALSILQENHGSSLVAFHRAHLIKAIYDGLPEAAKARYIPGTKLADITITSTGVKVTCTDGSLYSASILIGADGAHSKTRLLMRRYALQANPPLSSTWDPEQPFTSTYKCLWASFQRPSEPGDSYETQGQHRSSMYLTGRDKGWIFLYERLDQASSERSFYDEKAARSFGVSFAHWPLTEKLAVQDVLADPTAITGMTNLEEGIAQNVSWNGRIVLVGDAWHKFTPNSGLGFNNGVQDVVSLCNKLQALLVSPGITTPENTPASVALQKVFDEYQSERIDSLRADFLRSTHATRLSTWATWMDYLMGRYVYSVPFIQKFLTNSSVSPRISRGLVLDYLSSPKPFSGRVLWEYPTKKT
ncbi:FAD binding domain-containing [Fusarium albosuccineum]|uniref:FAD binding domain-containing n=1 Tax=Fusarium albosuccineum TaxID=1237068 RepID=A0A8H4PHQ1_9HYPO|nr:FAD binding domain-containing [Fusarium albosuccineum]